jgi:flagellar biosynthesis protein FlhF
VQYQTFRGADVQEALSSVKEALGPNAVIESTRHVTNGRRGGLGQSFVEVTAALPNGRTVNWPFSATLMQPTTAAARVPRTRAASSISRESNRAEEAPPNKSAKTPVANEFEREMVALRSMLEELNSKRSPKDRALSILQHAGIGGRTAKALAHNLGRGRDTAALRNALADRIRERLRVLPNLIAQSKRQMIVCVGPTGAGKTTTLAKLAARARLDFGRSVSVISLDTFRVGAIEQWQRYARLIGTAFGVARSGDDFQHVLSATTAELVLVDTAGRHCSDTDKTWPLGNCLLEVKRHELNVLVVLPAFLKAADTEQIIRTYADVSPSAAVLTKLDETQEIGGVMEAILEGEMPIAYTCEGPRVPEDIREGDLEFLIRCLLPMDA